MSLLKSDLVSPSLPALRIEPLTGSFGAVVRSRTADDQLASLYRDAVADLYVSSGAVLFRGFDVDVERFEAFTDRFTTDYVVNGNLTRQAVSENGTTQTVNTGTSVIAAHAELAYTPFRPDVIWFFCEKPASQNGETLLCDGIEVWSALREPTRELFVQRKLVYKKTYPSDRMNALAMSWFGPGLDARAVGEKLMRVPNTTSRVNEDGSLYLEYTVPAVQYPNHHTSLAFANSVIVEDKSCFFEDGEIISQDLRLEIFGVTSECAFLHRWQAGDVLMVDNTRMMHGRAPFRDPERRILVRMGREKV